MPQFKVEDYECYKIECICNKTDNIKLIITNNITYDVFETIIYPSDSVTIVSKYNIIKGAIYKTDGYSCVLHEESKIINVTFSFKTDVGDIPFSTTMSKCVADSDGITMDILTKAMLKFEAKTDIIINKLCKRIEELEGEQVIHLCDNIIVPYNIVELQIDFMCIRYKVNNDDKYMTIIHQNSRITHSSLKIMGQNLANFTRRNKNCTVTIMSAKIYKLLPPHLLTNIKSK